MPDFDLLEEFPRPVVLLMSGVSRHGRIAHAERRLESNKIAEPIADPSKLCRARVPEIVNSDSGEARLPSRTVPGGSQGFVEAISVRPGENEPSVDSPRRQERSLFVRERRLGLPFCSRHCWESRFGRA